jgi:hypothetical protein
VGEGQSEAVDSSVAEGLVSNVAVVSMALPVSSHSRGTKPMANRRSFVIDAVAWGIFDELVQVRKAYAAEVTNRKTFGEPVAVTSVAVIVVAEVVVKLTVNIMP